MIAIAVSLTGLLLDEALKQCWERIEEEDGRAESGGWPVHAPCPKQSNASRLILAL
jgi:hypothetical protein